MRKLIIMRGLPGSGKSTKARALAEQHGGQVFSTDDYFVGADGVYRFDGKRIAAAHEWNQERARSAMRDGVPCVIIDNTNTQAWEAREYCVAGTFHAYEIEFCEADTPWAFDPPVLAQKNAHGCPLEAIERMLDRWEDGLTVERCLGARAPWE